MARLSTLLLSSLILLILSVSNPSALVLEATKSSTQEAKLQPSPTVNIKFRIQGLDLIKQGVLVFITADNVSKGRIINSADMALLSKGSGGKFISSGFLLPRYLIRDGDKVKVCIMELQTIKVVCALGQYKSDAPVAPYIDIFMNSSKAFYPVPNVWRSIY